MQNKINNVIKVKDMIGTIGVGFALNPTLGGVAAVSVGVDLGLQQLDMHNQLTIDNINREEHLRATSFSNKRRGK